jgi:putative Mn2+ efflux pump MntP
VLETTAEVLPITWTAFVFALTSGGLMFASNAVAYAHNAFFQTKMSLLACWLASTCLVIIWLWDVTPRHGKMRRRRRSRRELSAALSLALWIAIAACGRWIGFTINAPT